MQSNSPYSVSNKKNSFSNFVFQTLNHKYKRDFKSESFVDSYHQKKKSPKKNSYTQTNFRSNTNISLKNFKKVEVFRENSTQTSKTVVAMVQTDLDMRLSPDSLSPKQGPRKPTIVDDNVLNMMESVLTVKELGSLPFNRKHNVMQYLESCEEFQKQTLLSGNSLTKAFLARIQNRKGLRNSQLHKRQYLDLNKTVQNSKEFTSPIVQSRSYIESPARNESVFIKQEKVTVPSKSSRFLVKNVTEKISVEDRTKPVKYYCRSKASDSVSTPRRTRRSTSFMSPTISSEQKDQSIAMKNIEKLISPTRRGRSLSPKKSAITNPDDTAKAKNVPYFDRSDHTLESETDTTINRNKRKVKDKCLEDLHLNLALSFDDMTNTTISVTSSTSTECILFQAINKLRDENWNTALRGLAEVVEICRVLDNEVILPHMTVINQRLIELIKCARSHVSRTACQAVGPIFEYIKDTRRPSQNNLAIDKFYLNKFQQEFDELVDTLLYKTADANKFIRHDANLALDCMVTHVSIYHAIRAICSKGPDHKNPLVRTAAARLMVCAVIIAGPEHILHPHNNEYTRKRIILNMVKFMEDKCHEVRKFGQRLCKLLYKDRIFDIYLKRYLERDVVLRLKKCLKSPR